MIDFPLPVLAVIALVSVAFDIGRRMGYWHGYAAGLVHREGIEAVKKKMNRNESSNIEQP